MHRRAPATPQKTLQSGYPMISMLLKLTALLGGTVLLLLGVGLLNTLLLLRGALEGFDDTTLGLFGSSYFGGFLVGTYLCPRLVASIGHVRAFAFFTAAVAACALGHVLLISAPLWIALRVITGMALVGLYITIESWLNGQAEPAQRGKVFAVYMVCNLGALAFGQQLLTLGSPAGFVLFAVTAIFVCVSAMPVMVTRLAPPGVPAFKAMSPRTCWRAAPVATAAALLSGLAMGGFWGMAAVCVRRLGSDPTLVADFMTTAIVGGMALQWPIGHFSDGGDRRRTLLWVAGAAAVAAVALLLAGAHPVLLLVAAFLFGGAAFSVYPIAVAHLIDHLHAEQILAGNAALLLVHGTGAALGPLLVGAAMSLLGAAALPLHFLLMNVLLAAFALRQIRRRVDRIVDAPAHFVPLVRTSTGALEMMVADQPAGAESGHDAGVPVS